MTQFLICLEINLLAPFELNPLTSGFLNPLASSFSIPWFGDFSLSHFFYPSGVGITTQPLLSLLPHDLEKSSLNHTGSFNIPIIIPPRQPQPPSERAERFIFRVSPWLYCWTKSFEAALGEIYFFNYYSFKWVLWISRISTRSCWGSFISLTGQHKSSFRRRQREKKGWDAAKQAEIFPFSHPTVPTSHEFPWVRWSWVFH